MRLFVTAFLLATAFASAVVRAEGLDWPRQDTVRITGPTGGSVYLRRADEIMIHLAQGAGPPPSTGGGPFTFTVPQSQVIVKISDPSLRPENAPSGRPGYFILRRHDPHFILSGWLEPASKYKGLDEFWQSEIRSPAYAGALAPTRVEMVRAGPWEVVAFDVPVPGGTTVHVRAERIQAGTWIDLHLSTTAAKPPPKLRAELFAALRRVEVVEK